MLTNSAEYVADHELLVDTLLTDLHVDALVQERLLIPQFPQARGVVGFDAARRVQRAEVVLRSGCVP